MLQSEFLPPQLGCLWCILGTTMLDIAVVLSDFLLLLMSQDIVFCLAKVFLSPNTTYSGWFSWTYLQYNNFLILDRVLIVMKLILCLQKCVPVVVFFLASNLYHSVCCSTSFIWLAYSWIAWEEYFMSSCARYLILYVDMWKILFSWN